MYYTNWLELSTDVKALLGQGLLLGLLTMLVVLALLALLALLVVD